MHRNDDDERSQRATPPPPHTRSDRLVPPSPIGTKAIGTTSADADADSVCTTVFDDEGDSRYLRDHNDSVSMRYDDALNHGHAASRSTSACPDVCLRKCSETLRIFAPAIRVGVFSFLFSFPSMFVKPALYDVKRTYFGGDKEAALVQSILDASFAAVNLLTAVLFGRALDAFGRRPFFLIAAALNVAAFVMLVALPNTPIAYMVVGEICGLVQTSFITTYLSDVADPTRRPIFFAAVAAVGSLVLLFGIVTATVTMSNTVTFVTGLVVAVLALVYAFFAIPESLSVDSRQRLRFAGAANPCRGIGTLFRSRVLRVTTVIVVAAGIADVGVGEVYAYYLNERVGFDAHDFGYLYFELAFLGPLCLVVLLPWLLRYVTPSLVLCVALVGNTAVTLIIATIWAKWPIFAFAGPMAGVMLMVSPIASGIVTNAGPPEEIARRLSALGAVSDACSAIGPLPFGLLYARLPGTLTALPFFVSAGVCLLAAVLATRIAPAVEEDVVREITHEHQQGDDGPAVATSARSLLSPDDIVQQTEARLLAASFRSAHGVDAF